MMQTNRKSAASAATLKDDKVSIMIKDRDLAGLEKLVLEGHGDDLFGKVARDPQTSAFLRGVPALQGSVEKVWEAAEKGQLKAVQNMLKEDKRLAHSKSPKGAGLLHAAVRADGQDLAAWLATKYPETLDMKDKYGRIPLHYAGAVRDPHAMFDILEKAGADSHITDKQGRLASYYIRHPEELRSNKTRNDKDHLNDDKIPSSKSFRSEPNTPRRSVTQLASARSASLADVGRQQPGSQNSAGSVSLNGSASGVLTGGVPVNRANIRKWIHEKDLGKLQQLVVEGYGNRLLYETASSSLIRKFLDTVPVSMRSIKEVHQAVVDGKSRDLEPYAKREDILQSRDQYGQTPLHKAAALGNHAISEFLVRHSRGALEARDHDKRIPLHMAAAPTNNKARAAMYELLKRGSDVNAVDSKGKNANYYQSHPNELTLQHIREIPEAPRASSQTQDTRKVLDAATPPKKKQDSGGKEKEKPRTAKSPPSDPYKERDKDKNRSPKTPPLDPLSVRSVSEDQIEKWVRAGDLERLEQLVLEGKGRRLQGRTSWDDEVRQFLKSVPKTMDKIAALHSAAGKGDLAQVRSIVRGADVRLAVAKNEAGATPLHQAALQGHVEVAGFLADTAPDTLRVGDMDKRTPLHYAALGKDRRRATQLFDLLVREGADKKAKDAKGNPAETYLHGAALRNFEDTYDKLSEYPPQRKPVTRQNTVDLKDKPHMENRKSAHVKEDLPSFRTEQGQYLASALGEALKKGLAEVASKRPKDPVSYLGTFLYSYAGVSDDHRSAKHVEGRSKSTSERTNRSRSLSHLDEDKDGHRDDYEHELRNKRHDKDDRRSSRSTRSLHDDHDKEPPRRRHDYDDDLHDDVDTRHAKRRMSQAELNAREDLRKDQNGQTVMHRAAGSLTGKEELEKLLQKAPPTALGQRDVWHRTPRDCAARIGLGEHVQMIDIYVARLGSQGNLKALEDLLEMGYDHLLDAEDYNGTNILTLTEQSGHSNVTEFLRETLGFEEKRDWLHKTIRNGNLTRVKEWMEEEEPKLFRVKNRQGRCSLHVAVLVEEPEIVEYIVEKFPETVHVVDEMNRTALHMAMGLFHSENVAECLLKAGVDKEATDMLNRTPSYYSLHKEDIEKLHEEENELKR